MSAKLNSNDTIQYFCNFDIAANSIYVEIDYICDKKKKYNVKLAKKSVNFMLMNPNCGIFISIIKV